MDVGASRQGDGYLERPDFTSQHNSESQRDSAAQSRQRPRGIAGGAPDGVNAGRNRAKDKQPLVDHSHTPDRAQPTY